MPMKNAWLVIALLLAPAPAVAQAGGSAQAAAGSADKALNLSAYAELLRSDVRAQKVAILTEVMGFTPEEDAAFWPIYREYEADMARLGDERLANIQQFATTFDTLTEDGAARIAAKAIDLDARRSAALARCHDKVKSALSARTALRFLQVEHQLQLLIDLQIAASLPVAPIVKE
ncbi:hypothetical protein TBR22_A00870 [Luteitalea sp. TBR-22]|uniref:hypothetical protein n=1 Tax=Luteitalea sp. TBR-22 TaxID=2802971 RepID=UPI001AF4CDE7|nr:hypothetical protein [Luteitalea sp. TBR-22]BCS30886.1 hypothetical protein TBR22_A00870 [Luteitalea sp. TBR-22]